MINFGRIEEQLFLGSTPQSSVDVVRLAQMKISAVLSLQSDEDFVSHRIDWSKLQAAYDYNDIRIVRYPIFDFNETDLAEKLAEPVIALNSLLIDGHRVYVHCNAGVCRAPATVLAYYCHYRGMELDQAIGHIRANRPQANPYMNAVKNALKVLSAR